MVAASTSAALQVAGLTKRYRNGTLANDAIDLAVPAGATVGLLGRNGAGKTTLVRQITGELQPSAGEVRVMGVDVLRAHTRARWLMGVVPQEAQPYDHLNAREHLAFFGRMRGLSRAQAARRAADLIDALGLADHARQPAGQLSGGLKRKLLVANALVGDPPVLVLDEPTTGLDPHSRREVWSLLRGLQGRGRTVLITTHYMDEAEELCDEVVVIAGGRIYAQGTVEQLRSRCRNQFKAIYRNGEGRGLVLAKTADDVLAELGRRGVDEYTLARTGLEDVYLELTAETLEE